MGNSFGQTRSPKTVKPAVPPLKRGDPASVGDLRSWHNAPSFVNLDKRGQEAFFKFLRGNQYSEDMDIISVPIFAEGMDGDAKRYQFWVKCGNFELTELFDVYVAEDETKIKDASEGYLDRADIKEKAQELENYVTNLKEKMKPDLDDRFLKFKSFLAEYEKQFSSQV